MTTNDFIGRYGSGNGNFTMITLSFLLFIVDRGCEITNILIRHALFFDAKNI